MWQEEKVYFNPEAYYSAVLHHIDTATSSVDVEMYIFERDRLGKMLLASLARAAARGVVVRLIIDGVGSSGWRLANLRAMAKRQVPIRIYNPAPRPFSLMFFRSWSNPARAIQFLLDINRRNHKKLILIDGVYAFVGSMNVSDEHSNWRETSVMVRGDDVAELGVHFEMSWSHSWNPDLPNLRRVRKRSVLRSRPLSLVRTNITRKKRSRHIGELGARIRLARERVWLTSAYFVPSPRLLRNLVLVANTGVDVRLLLPRKSDVRIVRWVSMLFYFPLIRAGIVIYEYLPSMLHAKTVLVDDWATIGTSNLNHRSLYHDLEVDVVLKSSDSIEKLARQFESDQENSDRVTEDWLESRPVLTRAAGYLGSLIRWWL